MAHKGEMREGLLSHREGVIHREGERSLGVGSESQLSLNALRTRCRIKIKSGILARVHGGERHVGKETKARNTDCGQTMAIARLNQPMVGHVAHALASRWEATGFTVWRWRVSLVLVLWWRATHCTMDKSSGLHGNACEG